MNLEELRQKQKEVDDRLANTPPSHLHRIRGEWVRTKIFKPWHQRKDVNNLDVGAAVSGG